MNMPKKYQIAIEVLKQELEIKKHNLLKVDKSVIKKVERMIKDIKAVLEILEGRE